MANTLPPVPYKVQVITGQGLLTQTWDAFFRELFVRIGGTSAPPLTELATLQTVVSALATRVTVLEGLDQGRQL